MLAMRSFCLPAVVIAVASAVGCTSEDYNVWELHGEAATNSAMHTCALRCRANPTCVASCLETKENYSPSCSKCFGGIALCSRQHCLFKCIGRRWNHPMCTGCVQANCVDSFNACTGVLELAAGRRLSNNRAVTSKVQDEAAPFISV